jgi:hypothetical protein
LQTAIKQRHITDIKPKGTGDLSNLLGDISAGVFSVSFVPASLEVDL